MKTNIKTIFLLSVLIALSLFSCTPQSEETVTVIPDEVQPENSGMIDEEFTLKTIAEGGKLLYIGVGGEIDGIVNPDIAVTQGLVVRIILTNGDGMVHDLSLPDIGTKTDYVRKIDDQAEIMVATGNMQPGSYVYYCTLPGHRKAGQEGKFIVEKK